jgi:hypothetical protein
MAHSTDNTALTRSSPYAEEVRMPVSRLLHIPGIGVDQVGDTADAANDPAILRLENLDTDLAPPRIVLDATRRAIEDAAANSSLPFQGHWPLRWAVGRDVGRPVVHCGEAPAGGQTCLASAGDDGLGEADSCCMGCGLPARPAAGPGRGRPAGR